MKQLQTNCDNSLQSSIVATYSSDVLNVAYLKLNGQEKRVIKASTSELKVKNATSKEILEVLGYCIALLNTSNVPTKEIKIVLVDFLKQKAPETTLADIKEAFMMVVARDLICETTNIDNVYSFSATFVMGVLDCYKTYRSKTMLKMQQLCEDIQRNNKAKPTYEQRFDIMVKWALDVYKTVDEDEERYNKISDAGQTLHTFLSVLKLGITDEEDIAKCEKLASQYINIHMQKEGQLSKVIKQVLMAWSIGDVDNSYMVYIAFCEYSVELIMKRFKQLDTSVDDFKEILTERKEYYFEYLKKTENE